MSLYENTFIIDGVRTPIGRFTGGLSGIRADDLAAIPIKALVERYDFIPSDAYDDVILGCANQAGEDNRNVARMSLLLAGVDSKVPGETVNRLCASGLSACIHAARAIAVGEGQLFIAGGIEHMTRGPFVLSKSSAAFGRDMQLYDSSFGWRFINPMMQKHYGTDAMGETAENLAELYNISRSDQDAFAYWSQMKTARAIAQGIFSQEIVPVSIPRRKQEDLVISQDEFPRPNTTLDALSQLKPVFKPADIGGSVTAGNSSGLNDGAAALLIAGAEAVSKYGLSPLARIVSSAVVGVEPRIMGIGPVNATKLALKRAGLSLADMDIIEINEAFAAQVLSCTRMLELSDDDQRLNPHGGAIALGHPLGMTGARLLLTAAKTLHRTGGRYALVTMCVGVGQGYAAIIEAVQ